MPTPRLSSRTESTRKHVSKCISGAALLLVAGCSTSSPTTATGPGDAGADAAIQQLPPSSRHDAGSRTTSPPSTERGRVTVDPESGRMMRDGERFQVRAASWFGLEGQDDLTVPGRMELFIGSPHWASAAEQRTIEQTMREARDELGLNTIRLPIAPQCLVAGHEDGLASVGNNVASLRSTDCQEALFDFIRKADAHDLMVIIDIHSCSNHIGWRAGRLDDAPPFVDSGRQNYDYAKDDYSCRMGEDAYSQSQWLDDLRTLAGLPEELGVDNILGIDIFNEPHDYTWNEWKEMAESAYDAIAEVNDEIIVIVEGVGGASDSGALEPHGDTTLNPNWGENLYGLRENPPAIPRARLCLSPHVYGPSVHVQPQFIDATQPGCEGLEDDAAAAAGCQIRLQEDILRRGWDEHFGYLRDEGYCILIGEFGGYADWPENPAEPEAAGQWSHLPSGSRPDWQWQNLFVDYLVDRCITDFSYWSLNPESADTGGLYRHAYDPATDLGWAIWNGIDPEKATLLRRITDSGCP